MCFCRIKTLSTILAFGIGLPAAALAEPSTALQTRTDHFRSVETIELSGGETETRVQSTSLLTSTRSLRGETATCKPG